MDQLLIKYSNCFIKWTIFPSKKLNEIDHEGMQLIIFKEDDTSRDDINIELDVIFEDRNGKKYKHVHNVFFNSSKERILDNNDMIEYGVE